MDNRFLEDLKSRIDLVEIAHKYTELKKSGKNFMARSPFRNERTPSFSISPEKQLWYDFGASEGGDAISFVEKIENVPFQEAVEILADMAGVQIPKNISETKTSKEDKKNIFSLHTAACEFFKKNLQKHKTTLDYLNSRGISENLINSWNLGYGGEASDGLTKSLMQSRFTEKMIIESGVSFEREFGDKKMRDRFWKRLIIPICEPRNGEIIAFGGRDLCGGKKTPKYVNSPENPVSHKSSTFFALDRAKKAISKKDAVILVEGYFDVISAHNAGFPNTIATCGTALTEDHLRILKRLTKNIYLAFDTDIAGKKATLKSVEMCLKAELNPFIIEIKEGKDFDELARKDTKKLKDAIESPENALSFFLNKFSQKNLDETIEGEKKFLDSFFYFLRFVSRPLERDHFLHETAKKINRSRSVIESEFKRFASRTPKALKPKFKPAQKAKFSREECFVGLISANWSLFHPKINNKLIKLFTPSLPQNLLSKKFQNKTLAPKENITLSAWEMHQENLYKEDTSDDILEKEFEIFVDWMKKEEAKRKRVEEAAKIRENLLRTEN